VAGRSRNVAQEMCTPGARHLLLNSHEAVIAGLGQRRTPRSAQGERKNRKNARIGTRWTPRPVRWTPEKSRRWTT